MPSLKTLSPPCSIHPIVVIGLGSVGSFALRTLAKRFRTKNNSITNNNNDKNKNNNTPSPRIIGIERFHPCHTMGSHHGHSRVFRHAYYEHPDYVPLCQLSTRRFEEVERESGIPLLERCGVLTVADNASADANEAIGEGDDDDDDDADESCHSSLIDKAEQSAKMWGIDVTRWDSHELKERFPMFDCRGKEGLWEPGGGFVRPESSIRAALSLAESDGATVLSHHCVTSLREINQDKNNVIEVTMDDSTTLIASSLIVTAGAYTKTLLPSLSPYLTVTRQRQGWIKCPEMTMLSSLTTRGRGDGSPVWFWDRGNGEPPYYGIPIDPLRKRDDDDDDDEAFLTKIAIHGGGETVVDPLTASRTLTTDEERLLEDAFSTVFSPLISSSKCPTLAHSSACLYTETPDHHFILDKIPGMTNGWVAAGLSGHGFKMAPALGEALADLAVEGQTDLPVGFLGMERLKGKEF